MRLLQPCTLRCPVGATTDLCLNAPTIRPAPRDCSLIRHQQTKPGMQQTSLARPVHTHSTRRHTHMHAQHLLLNCCLYASHSAPVLCARKQHMHAGACIVITMLSLLHATANSAEFPHAVNPQAHRPGWQQLLTNGPTTESSCKASTVNCWSLAKLFHFVVSKRRKCTTAAACSWLLLPACTPRHCRCNACSRNNPSAACSCHAANQQTAMHTDKCCVQELLLQQECLRVPFQTHNAKNERVGSQGKCWGCCCNDRPYATWGVAGASMQRAHTIFSEPRWLQLPPLLQPAAAAGARDAAATTVLASSMAATHVTVPPTQKLKLRDNTTQYSAQGPHRPPAIANKQTTCPADRAMQQAGQALPTLQYILHPSIERQGIAMLTTCFDTSGSSSTPAAANNPYTCKQPNLGEFQCSPLLPATPNQFRCRCIGCKRVQQAPAVTTLPQKQHHPQWQHSSRCTYCALPAKPSNNSATTQALLPMLA